MTPATSPPPRASPREMSDQEAMEILSRLCQSDRRSEFAQAIFPYDPEKYRSKSEWRKAVGTRVSNDIHRDAELCQRMYRAGYKPRVTGYTLEQRVILVKYYMTPSGTPSRTPSSLTHTRGAHLVLPDFPLKGEGGMGTRNASRLPHGDRE